MKNKSLELKLSEEILNHIASRRTLTLATVNEHGTPYASYAPFAYDGQFFYILISDVAIHGRNLAQNQNASVMIIEDEDSADEIFARLRVTYEVNAEQIFDIHEAYSSIIECLAERQGKRIHNLNKLSDFRLFRLSTKGGRYVKGFGKAYSIPKGSIAGEGMEHIRDGHKK